MFTSALAGLTSLKLSSWQVKQLPASIRELANLQLTHWGCCLWYGLHCSVYCTHVLQQEMPLL
jgi:hypothetical protein